jgi:hypothetical protein
MAIVAMGNKTLQKQNVAGKTYCTYACIHTCSVRVAYTIKKGVTIFPSPAGMPLTKQSLAWNNLHCKKRFGIFPSPAGMPLTKLSLAGIQFNYFRPGRVWLVTSRLGTGKSFTMFYSVLVYNCTCILTCAYLHTIAQDGQR